MPLLVFPSLLASFHHHCQNHDNQSLVIDLSHHQCWIGWIPIRTSQRACRHRPSCSWHHAPNSLWWLATRCLCPETLIREGHCGSYACRVVRTHDELSRRCFAYTHRADLALRCIAWVLRCEIHCVIATGHPARTNGIGVIDDRRWRMLQQCVLSIPKVNEISGSWTVTIH